ATWYAGGGEFRGTGGWTGSYSAYYALGLYQSSDNGESWTLMPNSIAGSPSSADAAFDFVARMAVNPVTGTLFVTNNFSGVYRADSQDLTASFPRVLGSLSAHQYSEVAAGPDGRLVATLSTLNTSGGQSAAGGVYLSEDDGLTWTEITPSTYPAVHQRTLIAIAPSNPDVAYLLTLVSQSLTTGEEDFRFHKINLTTGASEDRSANLPDYPGSRFHGARLYSFLNYAMVLGVKPDDEDFVVVGGIQLYRSTDGFATPIPTFDEASIGGYSAIQVIIDPVYADFYPNHYIDQHAVAFDPADPEVMWNGNDGGVFLTRNVSDDEVVWENTNGGGLNVAQAFTLFISEEAGDPRIATGLQDTGTSYIRDLRSDGGAAEFTPGERIFFNDGGFGYFGSQYVFASISNGRFSRLNYSNAEQTEIQSSTEAANGQGGPIGNALIELMPPGATGFKFYIHPLLIDPNDGQTAYYSDGGTGTITATMWRNPNLNAPNPIPNWQRLDNFALPSGYYYTTYGISRSSPPILYLGATNTFNAGPPRIFRLENANTATDGLEEVSIPNTPTGAFVHSIAVNPEDADELIVVLSNFNILGLYHSADGGQTYIAIEGNLAGTNNDGPSLRSASILPLTTFGDARSVYFVATSVGLFSTMELDGMNTVWTQEATEMTGNVIANHVVSRRSDGRVAVGTHGRGVFVGDVDPTTVANEFGSTTPTGFALAPAAPNPFRGSTRLSFTLPAPGHVSLTIYDVTGRRVAVLLDGVQQAAGTHRVDLEGQGLASGTYIVRLEAEAAGGEGRRFAETQQVTLIR
ncbi:MAG: T9SS type A sorting domain-containing protein, partial [Rhodothermaceae bacterium]|nr:T9SS type A sorting domain-containing protein [Rhodothermaceae bacterium]